MDETKARVILTKHEGVREKPYLDTVGKLTIGVGRNLDDVGLFPDEIQFLLSNDIKRSWKGLVEKLPWVEQLDEVRQHVLLDMCFNLGLNGLMQFKNTLVLIEKGAYANAAGQMLKSKWAGQVGKRALRLSKMMETGEWPNDVTF